MKKSLFLFFALLLFSSSIFAQSPNADTDLVWKFYPEGNITQMKLTSDNKFLVYGKEFDSLMYFLDTETGLLNKTIPVKRGKFVFSLDTKDSVIATGNVFSTKNNDISIDFYNSNSGEYLYSLYDDSLVISKYNHFLKVNFSKDGKYLLACVNRSSSNPESKYGGSLFLWDLQTRKVVKRFQYNIGYYGGIIDNNSKYIAVRYNGHIAIIDFNNFQIIKELPQDVKGFDFSLDGKYLATCGYDGYIKIWDINNVFTLWKERWYNTQGGGLRHIRFTSDNKYIVSGGGGDSYTTIWDLIDNKIVKDYGDLSGGDGGIEISNDNKYIYTYNGGINKLLFNNKTSINYETNKSIIYPNPVTNILTLKTICNLAIIQYSISNQIGQILVTNDVQNINNQIKIDFSQFSNGTYFLKFNCNENINNFKIIKE
jgi:WD40 repeat protein